MSTFLLTLIIAFVLVVIAIVALSISWLVTGKSKIVRGACGMDPHKLRDQKKCGAEIKCGLCEDDKKSKQEKEIEKHHDDEHRPT